MLADYFNKENHTIFDSYEILLFISKLPEEIAYEMFYSLDMNKVQFKRLALNYKKYFIKLFKRSLKLTDPQEILSFMGHVEELYAELEKLLLETLTVNNDLCDKYVSLINSVDKHTPTTLQIVTNMKSIYKYSDRVNQFLFDNKAYSIYVVSLTLNRNQFDIEWDKIVVLWPIYITIFKSKEYKKTRARMADNIEFLERLMQEKVYIGVPEENRMYFSKVRQTPESLENILQYGESFAKGYLSIINGFISKEAAEKFIEIIDSNLSLAQSREVYENTYSLLLDPQLKSKYTRIHNKASENKSLVNI